MHTGVTTPYDLLHPVLHPDALETTYGVTYLKIVVETPLFVVVRFVVNRPLGMLPWST